MLIVRALSVTTSNLKYALSKFGNSRVGTNSLFCIKHKKEGRKRVWTSWLFLILTSLPVHFSANSLIGPSYTKEVPAVITLKMVDDVIDSPLNGKEDDPSNVINVVLQPCHARRCCNEYNNCTRSESRRYLDEYYYSFDDDFHAGNMLIVSFRHGCIGECEMAALCCAGIAIDYSFRRHMVTMGNISRKFPGQES